MPLLLALAILLLAVAVLYRATERVPQLPRAVGDWGFGSSNDPRVAVAAMMYAVATESHPLSPEQERHILSLLSGRIGLESDAARACLTGGRRMASRLRGDLNARLHRLLEPVARRCTAEEKADVIDMLHIVAGPRAKLLGPVRDGLGRVSATLMND